MHSWLRISQPAHALALRAKRLVHPAKTRAFSAHKHHNLPMGISSKPIPENARPRALFSRLGAIADMYAYPLRASHYVELVNPLWASHKLQAKVCLLYTSPSPRDVEESRMPSSA